MEQPPRPSEIDIPVVEYPLKEGRYDFHWMNAKLRMYPDTDFDEVDYAENDHRQHFSVPQETWDRMMELKFPFSFYATAVLERWWENPNGFNTPPQNKGDYEPLQYTDDKGNTFYLMWHNTRLRLYGEPEYNHIEYRVVSKNAMGNAVIKTKGITDLQESEWRILFHENYPIEYLPTVEMDLQTKQWFARRNTDE